MTASDGDKDRPENIVYFLTGQGIDPDRNGPPYSFQQILLFDIQVTEAIQAKRQNIKVLVQLVNFFLSFFLET